MGDVARYQKEPPLFTWGRLDVPRKKPGRVEGGENNDNSGSSSHLQPEGDVDDGVCGADGVPEVPPSPGRGDQRRREDEGGADRVHDAQVLHQEEVDAAELQVRGADVVDHEGVGGQGDHDDGEDKEALERPTQDVDLNGGEEDTLMTIIVVL